MRLGDKEVAVDYITHANASDSITSTHISLFRIFTRTFITVPADDCSFRQIYLISFTLNDTRANKHTYKKVAAIDSHTPYLTVSGNFIALPVEIIARYFPSFSLS